MKRILFFGLIMYTAIHVKSQFVALIEWQKTMGAYMPDYLYDMQQTYDKGYIVAGASASNAGGEKTQNSRGSYDFWVVKLSPQRTVEWEKTLGGNLDDGGVDFDEGRVQVLQCADSGYIVAGSSNSGISGEKTQATYGGRDYWILKLDKSGNIIWQKTIGGSSDDYLYSIKQTSDGGYILGGLSNSNISGLKTQNTRGGFDYWVVKVNDTGVIQWQKDIGSMGYDQLRDVLLVPGGYLLAGTSEGDLTGDKTENAIGGSDFWVIMVNDTGAIQWQNTIGGNRDDRLRKICAASDGGYILAGMSYSGIFADKTDTSRGERDYWVVKINATGQIVWQKTIGGSDADDLYALLRTRSGDYVIAGTSFSNISGDKTENRYGYEDYWVVKISKAGNIMWQKDIGGSREDDCHGLALTEDDNVIVLGSSSSDISGLKTEGKRGPGADYWMVKLKQVENPDTVTGHVFVAKNSDCNKDVNEMGRQGIIVQTENNGYFAITDSLGKYILKTDTGVYRVKQITPLILQPFLDGDWVCPVSGTHTVTFNRYGQDTTINFANYEKQCAYLQVNVTQHFLRRCFDNHAVIRYCNIGNVDTTNVQVHLKLPEYMTMVSADKPYTTAADGHQIFNIGNLAAGACGEIQIVDHVACLPDILGLTQCVKTWITPANICVQQWEPDYILWDKSEITTAGICLGSSFRFVIENTGQNMADSSDYRLYKDGTLAIAKKFKLNAGDSLVITIAGIANTIRLEADQNPYHPGDSRPNATVQGCPQSGSLPSANNLPPDDEDLGVAVHCLRITGSYDPNDKKVSPEGVGIDNRVKHGVSLNYVINFQNVGNDTAFRVVVEDTLDSNLDIATLELGTSSHPHKVEFAGTGRPILKFTFDPIKLVDSMTNEPMSHGFVSFKIKPYDSIPNGTVVKNAANIYFDFNDPIRTNTAQVTINDSLPTGAVLNVITGVGNTVSKDAEKVKVYPNPFSGSTTFEFANNSRADRLTIFDVSGQTVFKDLVRHEQTYILTGGSFPPGMYFYSVTDKNDVVVGRGKLIVQ